MFSVILKISKNSFERRSLNELVYVIIVVVNESQSSIWKYGTGMQIEHPMLFEKRIRIRC